MLRSCHDLSSTNLFLILAFGIEGLSNFAGLTVAIANVCIFVEVSTTDQEMMAKFQMHLASQQVGNKDSETSPKNEVPFDVFVVEIQSWRLNLAISISNLRTTRSRRAVHEYRDGLVELFH